MGHHFVIAIKDRKDANDLCMIIIFRADLVGRGSGSGRGFNVTGNLGQNNGAPNCRVIRQWLSTYCNKSSNMTMIKNGWSDFDCYATTYPLSGVKIYEILQEMESSMPASLYEFFHPIVKRYRDEYDERYIKEQQERERREKEAKEKLEKERKGKEDLEKFISGFEERFALAESKSSLREKAEMLGDIIEDAKKCLQFDRGNKRVELQFKLANDAYCDIERKVLAERQCLEIKRELASLRTQWSGGDPQQILITYEQLARQSGRDLSLYDVLFERSCFCLEIAKQSTYTTQQRMLYQKANEDLRRVCQHDPFHVEALSLLDQVEAGFKSLNIGGTPIRSVMGSEKPEITRADLTAEQLAKLEEIKARIVATEGDQLPASGSGLNTVGDVLFFRAEESAEGERRNISTETSSKESLQQTGR